MAPLGVVIGRWVGAAPAALVVVFSEQLLPLGQVPTMIRPAPNQIVRAAARA